MDKILTVSIAAYNVEKYLEKALKSCLIDDVKDKLEVLIISDGSTDRTIEIAKEYQNKYPTTFKLIEKENGGYGSTVNTGIKEATGKYFKLLDGDDWFDQDGLKTLIKILETVDADCIINRLFYVLDDSNEKKISQPEWEVYEGKLLNVKEIHKPMWTGMWQMTVKTELLKSEQYFLPEHILYTDQLFVVNAMSRIDNVFFSNIPVYCYRIGRNGQSVSKESRIKNYKMNTDVFLKQVDLYNNSININEKNRNFVLSRIGRYYFYVIRTLLLMPKSKEIYRELVELEKYTKSNAYDIYKYAAFGSKKVKLLRLTLGKAYYLFAGKEDNWM